MNRFKSYLNALLLFFARENLKIRSRSVTFGRFMFSVSGVLVITRKLQSRPHKSPHSRQCVLVITSNPDLIQRQNTLHLIDGFRNWSGANQVVQLTHPDEFGRLSVQGVNWDSIVVLYDVLELRTTPWWHTFVKSILRLQKSSNCQKFIVIVQDDYTGCGLLDHFFCLTNTNVVYSGASSIAGTLYPKSMTRSIRFEHCLTGFAPDLEVSDVSSGWVPFDSRKWDIGSRVRSLNPVFGEQGMKKSLQVMEVESLAKSVGLSTNISTNQEDFFYGDSWFEFLSTCRCVPVSSGGASKMDRQGLLTSFALFCDLHKMTIFNGLNRFLSKLILQDCHAPGFSPRIFEATVAGCVLLIDQESETLNLVAGTDFVPITDKKQQSLLILKQLLDDNAKAQMMVQSSLQKLVGSGSYSVNTFVERVLEPGA
jgi:hypothetical protein